MNRPNGNNNNTYDRFIRATAAAAGPTSLLLLIIRIVVGIRKHREIFHMAQSPTRIPTGASGVCACRVPRTECIRSSPRVESAERETNAIADEK